MKTGLTLKQRDRMAVDLTVYNAYFEDIVKNFSLLNGFYELDMNEWEQFVNDLRGNQVPSPCLVLEDFELAPGIGGSGSFVNTVEGAVAVLGQYDPREIGLSPTAFLNYILYITTQVRAKMVVDKQNGCNLMKHLDIRSLRLTRIEKVGEFVGFRMPVRLTVEDRTLLDRGEWGFLPFDSV